MAAQRYVLDTNIVSFILRGASPDLQERISGVAPASLCISVITEAELRYGLARLAEAKRLQRIVHEFLLRVNILPWTSAAARSYASLRATLDTKGQSFGNLDLLIAAHTHAEEAVPVTNDRSLMRLPDVVAIQDWASGGGL